MSNTVTLIFPHQLFENHPALQQSRDIYLVEEWLFFRQYQFHRQKLVLHRASMKFYQQWLQQHGYQVHYIEAMSPENDCRQLIAALAKQKVASVHLAAVADNWLERRLTTACAKHGIAIRWYDSPNWLNNTADTADYFDKKKSYFQTDFYKWQRVQRNILLEADNQPVGGRWTYDTDNRKKFPKNETVPALKYPKSNDYVTEAEQYIKKHFPDTYGNLGSPHLFSVTFADAKHWLNDFLKNRFEKFGIYEDAIVANQPVLHHSVLTPMLNIGLLQPRQIIESALDAAADRHIPLNSLEGFLRQIMGWREFIHLVYEREGTRQRTTNYWNFKRKIPKSFWTGDTGIAPIDLTIKKLLQTGYCHHIERLMVLGNFMLLCEFDPDEVYRWFMEMFIDAYDWVMVPNIYGMTQFADGGLMMTKPYISGSNYLMKMSDYPKGEWQAVWDGLFWRFMHVHRDFFESNPRLGMLLKTFDKFTKEKRNSHLRQAKDFLEKLDGNL